MTRHAKVYDKLNGILNQEWRDKEDLEEIKDDLRKRKNEKIKFSLRSESFDSHIQAWKKKRRIKK